MGKQIKLSAIITAHHEGLLAHKTMISIFEALEKLDSEKFPYEVIVHMDNPDEETSNYFKKYEKDERVTLYENHFGDLGLSRNFAIEHARGEYIGVIDADDLTSPNWFIEAIKRLEKSKNPVIVHPEYNLTFGTNIYQSVLWTQKDSKDLQTDKKLLAGANQWTSMCFGRKDTFMSHKYLQAGRGYGNEDWNFNSETRIDGIKHVVAENVVQFYRRKTDSLLSANESNKLIQWPTRLMDIMEYKKIPLVKQEIKSKTNYKAMMVRGFRKVHGTLLRTPLRYVLLPTGEVVKKVIHYKSKNQQAIPGCVLEEWKKINHIEAQLYPFDGNIEGVVFYSVANSFIIGDAFRQIIEPITKMPDYILIVPWLVAGGADKVVLNYIKALSTKHPDWTIAVITTLPSRNEWKNKLPANAYILDFGNITEKLNEHDKEAVFDRLIAELRCKRVHLINSQYGYRYIANHRDLFKNHFDLFVSIFNFDYVPNTNMQAIFDYADPYLVEIFPVVKKVFTDNQAIIDRDVAKNGFDADKFTVHYQPFSGEVVPFARRPDDKVVHILWASRVCNQKLPLQAVKIAQQLDPRKYQIDMYGSLENDFKKSDFAKIKNLSYKGTFNGLSSIDVSKYDMYLYTSNSDGMPNCILEAVSLGLPVIAPKIGGIGEFIQNKQTGILIDDYMDVDAYCEAIKYLSSLPDRGESLVQNAQQLLQKRHSWDSFINEVDKDIK